MGTTYNGTTLDQIKTRVADAKEEACILFIRPIIVDLLTGYLGSRPIRDRTNQHLVLDIPDGVRR